MSVLRNPKHETFAQEIAVGKTALEAYTLAGFKRPRDSNARRLRNWPPVRERVKEISLAAAELAGVHLGAIQLELARIGFANMLDYVRVGKDGLPYVDLSKLSREQAAAISEFTIDTEVKLVGDKEDPEAFRVTKARFKLHDKRGALSDLAKMVGGVADPLADAVTGLGDRLDRALQRATAA